MEKIIIVAVANNNVIGNNNQIPWYIKQDLRHFQELTTGSTVIMGRNTWDSLPVKPLKNRINIVITSKTNTSISINKVQTYKSITEALKNIKTDKVYFIGGAGIYKEALQIANKIELTEIDHDFDGTVFFPEYKKWREIKSSPLYTSDDGIKYRFKTLVP
jgi:dihydrofolate reductase